MPKSSPDPEQRLKKTCDGPREPQDLKFQKKKRIAQKGALGELKKEVKKVRYPTKTSTNKCLEIPSLQPSRDMRNIVAGPLISRGSVNRGF